MNVRLRTAIQDAKAVSMPKDNIERAIKKGTGELDGGNVEEIVYEGYGPGGAAVMCDIMTDNRNRTAPELRKLFELYGGKLSGANCVGWMFERKGLFEFPADRTDEDKLMEAALEAGANDVKQAGDRWEVTCPPDRYSQVADALAAAGLEPETKELTRIPATTVELSGDDARRMMKLMEALDDHDDVQNVSSNVNFPDDVMAELSASS
jgi:YebC/PmpR family DNA-binding regulatory protein